MKLNRTSHSVILAALAAMTIAAPVLAQQPSASPSTSPSPSASPSASAKPSESGSPEAPAAPPTTNADGSEVTVTGKNTLVTAVDMATKTLSEGKVKEVTIKITTCDDQTLPAEINAKGKISIVGCNAKPSGPGSDYKEKRTVLVPANAEGTVVKSPLDLSGVMGTVPGNLLQVQSSFKLTNSQFSGKTIDGKRASRVVFANLDPKVKDQEILIENVSFYHAVALQGDTAAAKVTVKNSLMHEVVEKGRQMVDITPSKEEGGEVLIEGNEWDSHRVRDDDAPLHIARGKVKVVKNFFYLDAPAETGGGIRLINPEADKGLPLKDIEISGNQFLGSVAIDNPEGTPIPKDAVKVFDNDFSKATAVLPPKDKVKVNGTVTTDKTVDARNNFWGALKLDEVVADTSDAKKEIPDLPWKRLVNRYAGETRFETAALMSSRGYRNGAETVVIARGDNVADSVSAVPLAQELNAPILLTPSDKLHEAVAKEIKRLQPKGGKVVLMGGEVAINKSVEEELVKGGSTVERIAGANRAATAVETAKKLKNMNKLAKFVLVDGADWQPDLIAGPLSAKLDAATVLTNGDKIAPETAAFLKENDKVEVVAVGDNAVGTKVAKETVAGKEGTALSLEVANKYFKDTKIVGVATTADFADALPGGRHIAQSGAPILLSAPEVPASISDYLKTNVGIGWVNVYGGETRFSEKVVEGFGK